MGLHIPFKLKLLISLFHFISPATPPQKTRKGWWPFGEFCRPGKKLFCMLMLSHLFSDIDLFYIRNLSGMRSILANREVMSGICGIFFFENELSLKKNLIIFCGSSFFHWNVAFSFLLTRKKQYQTFALSCWPNVGISQRNLSTFWHTFWGLHLQLTLPPF